MHHWFKGDSVAQLKAALEAAGPDARLEVHQSGDRMSFKIVKPGEVVAEVNDSFVCPPICP